MRSTPGIPSWAFSTLTDWLKKQGNLHVGTRRTRHLLRLMGLMAIYPGPNLSRRAPGHKIYPYLLRNVPIVRVNQVWSVDITYIRRLSLSCCNH